MLLKYFSNIRYNIFGSGLKINDDDPIGSFSQ